MAEKKETEDKITVVQFKEKSSDWWVNGSKHYNLTKDNELILVAGGIEIKEETEFLQSFIRRNKKGHSPRIANIFENEPKQYLEIIPCTELKGRTVSEAFELNKNLLKWFRDKYTFKSGEEKLKEQIIEILKK